MTSAIMTIGQEKVVVSHPLLVLQTLIIDAMNLIDEPLLKYIHK